MELEDHMNDLKLLERLTCRLVFITLAGFDSWRGGGGARASGMGGKGGECEQNILPAS